MINDHDNLRTSISEGMLNYDLQMKFNDVDIDDEDTVEDSVEIRINDYKTGISHTGCSGAVLFASLKL